MGYAAESRARYDVHKGDFGHLWIFGGSTGYTGAPRLAALGAMGVHAGLVSIACDASVYSIVATSSVEAMVHPQETAPWQSADAIVAGPGWGRNQQEMLAALLDSDKPLLLDADALNMLADDAMLLKSACARTALTVFTPHPGEAARLLGCNAEAVQEGRREALKALSDKLGGWVVLKGAGTLIASRGGEVWLCPFGSARLATAGSGDVLSGMIGGLLAHGLEPEKAITAAVILHAKAGEASGWYRAGQLPERVAELRDASV